MMACNTGKPGVCGEGKIICMGMQPFCVSATQASPELCNGLDDDCNGQVDDLGQACMTGQQGACSAGTLACSGNQQVCNASAVPSPETCNGIDDDCNGQVDDLGQACVTGLLGVCSAGKLACNGNQQVCNATAAPVAETCNGLDDDCNGLVDDVLTCATGLMGACSIGAGSCVQGMLVCTPPAPSMETCNGVDDDCNGQVDDLPRSESVNGYLGVTVTNLTFNNGMSYTTVKPGDIIPLSFDYTIYEGGACGARDQIQIGFSPSPPQVCAYDGNPGCAPGTSGKYMGAIFAPMATGPHPISVDRTAYGSCISQWQDANLPTIGMVCVVP